MDVPDKPVVELVLSVESDVAPAYELGRMPVDFPLEITGTTVSYDHQKFLGNALAALEKYVCELREEIDRA